jgi:hypothetical protein
MLDAVARRYGTDPARVARWSPYRLGLALICMDQAQADERALHQRINAQGMPVFPAYLVGGL